MLVSGVKSFSQTKFNIVSDFGHREMQVLFSVTPLEEGYVIVVGTGDELYGDNRCSMIVKTDIEGNKLYSTIVGDHMYDVYETTYGGSSVYVTEAGTYKFIFNVGPRVKLLQYEFDTSLQVIDTMRICSGTIAETSMQCNMYDNDYIYIGGVDRTDWLGFVARYDLSGNIITMSDRFEHSGIWKLVLETNKNIIAAGQKTNEDRKWVVQKLDTSLNILWQKEYGRQGRNNGAGMFIGSIYTGVRHGQVIDSIYYPDIFVPSGIGIDTVLSGDIMYNYTENVTEATIKDTATENIIARHYNIATPTLPGEQQLAITHTDYYGNTKTIYKDIYVNVCHEVDVNDNENVVLSVYPNPARENIMVDGENIVGIQICNLLGGIVYETQQCNSNNAISTDGMGAGSYFVRITMADSKVVTKKIVVVK